MLNDKLRKVITEKIKENRHMFSGSLSEEDLDQIKNISISILNTKYRTGPQGGSFVRAIVDNDLKEAVTRADSSCIKALRFFCYVEQYISPNN